jgi:hypothetical protein
MKEKKHKKKRLQSPLSFRQQLEIQVRDLLLDLLQLSAGFEACLDFRPQFSGHRNLPQATTPKADREDPNGPVAFPLALTITAACFVAAYHSAQ